MQKRVSKFESNDERCASGVSIEVRASGELPIPPAEFHYADPASSAQTLILPSFIDHVHYPTLGCPALLSKDKPLRVLLSLPRDISPDKVSMSLCDRHGTEETYPLVPESQEKIDDGPDGSRFLWRVEYTTKGLPHKLFDLALDGQGFEETQPNAVRVFRKIRGDEPVVLCGDSQLHKANTECLERFVERMNTEDAAWIAMIGDVCDNGVRSSWHVIKLAAGSKDKKISHYYEFEYAKAHELLSGLNKPIFLVPGNHDGMAAYEGYGEGKQTTTYLGPDSKNTVVYDGLEQFRRTFGPLYFSFDWGNTRYLCLNSFELDRHDRLGYHCIVSNWGGWIGDHQATWIKQQLDSADKAGLDKVVLMHHDPRGGSKGKKLGRFHERRPYDLTNLGKIIRSYLAYYLRHGKRTAQQEWMAHEPIENHPVKDFLEMLVNYRVSSIFMGHDNENWVDSYAPGADLLWSPPDVTHYLTPPPSDPELPIIEQEVEKVAKALRAGEMKDLQDQLENIEESEREATILAALDSLSATNELDITDCVPLSWKLRTSSSLHFVHVDDVGAYKHSKEKHYRDYGYVLARLENGKPRFIQSYKMSGDKKTKKVKLVD